MMYCKKCDSVFKEGGKFCPSCGSQDTIKVKFCPECGNACELDDFCCSLCGNRFAEIKSAAKFVPKTEIQVTPPAEIPVVLPSKEEKDEYKEPEVQPGIMQEEELESDPKQDYKFCIKCGEKCTADAGFCPSCGTTFYMEFGATPKKAKHNPEYLKKMRDSKLVGAVKNDVKNSETIGELKKVFQKKTDSENKSSDGTRFSIKKLLIVVIVLIAIVFTVSYLKDNLVSCYDCGKIVWEDDAYYLFGENYCEDCLY